MTFGTNSHKNSKVLSIKDLIFLCVFVTKIITAKKTMNPKNYFPPGIPVPLAAGALGAS